MKKVIIIILFLISSYAESSYILIPMDNNQTNHLKSYGIAFMSLENKVKVDWLLNYRGGSFLIKHYEKIEKECIIRNVSYEIIADVQSTNILNEISSPSINQDVIRLEKTPKIAIYSPKYKQPWDDAVTMALTYAEIPYDVIYDTEVLSGILPLYDWLHLHHEDFTGQYAKFYSSFKNTNWYKEQKKIQEDLAKNLGFNKVSEAKLAVAKEIKEFIMGGGFLFAMCSATDSFDIALSIINVDAVHSVFDGSPIDKNLYSKIDYNNSLAFTNFDIITDPMVYEYSDIDYPQSNNVVVRGAEADYFSLFEFSAKYDRVPTMLTQNHVPVIKGFMGQTTGFNREKIKKHVLIMGEDRTTPQVKYIHGNHGQGPFTFLGGHDPEDYQHFVGDPQTDLSLHQNSPGYRLILNNILFPAARKKERKT